MVFHQGILYTVKHGYSEHDYNEYMLTANSVSFPDLQIPTMQVGTKNQCQGIGRDFYTEFYLNEALF